MTREAACQGSLLFLGASYPFAFTALRLARFFKMSPQFWLGLQMDYDLDVATEELRERLEREVVTLVG